MLLRLHTTPLDKKRINYVGWVGHNNMGDEGIYEVNKNIFEPYQLVPYKKEHCSKISLLGGGTLFPGLISDVMPNRYNYVYSVGVRDPSFWGDFHPVMIVYKKRFNFRCIGARDSASKKLLAAWGIDSIVVGDPCLLLEPLQYGNRKDTKIAINVGSDGFVWGWNEEKVFIEIAKVCRLLRRKGYRPVLIPFCKKDLSNIKMISRVTKTEIFSGWTDIQAVLNFVASCHMLIGERLHSLVFSAATYTPFISIEYRPKCRAFAETVGFEDYNIKTDTLVAERVMGMVKNLSDNWAEMEKHLMENVKIYRKKLRTFANYIKKDIDSLQNDKWTPSALEKTKWFLNIHRRILIHELSIIKRHQLQIRRARLNCMNVGKLC